MTRPPEPSSLLEDDGAAALDGVALADLMAMGGRAFAEEVIALFLEETAPRLSDLRASLAADNLPAVRRVAHALHGGAGQLGASAFAAAARDLELGAAKGDPGLAAMMTRLEGRSRTLARALEAWREAQAQSVPR